MRSSIALVFPLVLLVGCGASPTQATVPTATASFETEPIPLHNDARVMRVSAAQVGLNRPWIGRDADGALVALFNSATRVRVTEAGAETAREALGTGYQLNRRGNAARCGDRWYFGGVQAASAESFMGELTLVPELSRVSELFPDVTGKNLLISTHAGYYLVDCTGSYNIERIHIPAVADSQVASATRDGDAYLAVAFGGALYGSRDRGRTWTRIPTPGQASMFVSTTVSNGFLLLTSDGIKSVQAQGSGWRIEASSADGDALFPNLDPATPSDQEAAFFLPLLSRLMAGPGHTLADGRVLTSREERSIMLGVESDEIGVVVVNLDGSEVPLALPEGAVVERAEPWGRNVILYLLSRAVGGNNCVVLTPQNQIRELPLGLSHAMFNLFFDPSGRYVLANGASYAALRTEDGGGLSSVQPIGGACSRVSEPCLIDTELQEAVNIVPPGAVQFDRVSVAGGIVLMTTERYAGGLAYVARFASPTPHPLPDEFRRSGDTWIAPDGTIFGTIFDDDETNNAISLMRLRLNAQQQQVEPVSFPEAASAFEFLDGNVGVGVAARTGQIWSTRDGGSSWVPFENAAASSPPPRNRFMVMRFTHECSLLDCPLFDGEYWLDRNTVDSRVARWSASRAAAPANDVSFDPFNVAMHRMSMRTSYQCVERHRETHDATGEYSWSPYPREPSMGAPSIQTDDANRIRLSYVGVDTSGVYDRSTPWVAVASPEGARLAELRDPEIVSLVFRDGVAFSSPDGRDTIVWADGRQQNVWAANQRGLFGVSYHLAAPNSFAAWRYAPDTVVDLALARAGRSPSEIGQVARTGELAALVRGQPATGEIVPNDPYTTELGPLRVAIHATGPDGPSAPILRDVPRGFDLCTEPKERAEATIFYPAGIANIRHSGVQVVEELELHANGLCVRGAYGAGFSSTVDQTHRYLVGHRVRFFNPESGDDDLEEDEYATAEIRCTRTTATDEADFEEEP